MADFNDNMTFKSFDLTKEYNERVDPLVKALGDLLNELKMPFAITIQYKAIDHPDMVDISTATMGSTQNLPREALDAAIEVIADMENGNTEAALLDVIKGSQNIPNATNPLLN